MIQLAYIAKLLQREFQLTFEYHLVQLPKKKEEKKNKQKKKPKENVFFFFPCHEKFQDLLIQQPSNISHVSKKPNNKQC